jgi:NAD-dependent DNA ligase
MAQSDFLIELDKSAVRERVDRLRAELERHNRLYYEHAAPEISDQEFDALLRELQDLEDQHPEFAAEDSPRSMVWRSLCFTKTADSSAPPRAEMASPAMM